MKFKKYVGFLFPLVVFGFLAQKVLFRVKVDSLKEGDAIHSKAIIIDERNYMGNQPVDPKFSYSYSFFVNGIQYKGDSHDSTLRIGDSVEIEYDKNSPKINRPLHPRE